MNGPCGVGWGVGWGWGGGGGGGGEGPKVLGIAFKHL
jgi:hypothetical protein